MDFKKLGVLFLPIQLRKPILIGFVKSLLAPIIRLHQEFNLKKSDSLYRLQHNGQVCYLRKALNDRFDVSLRRIKIDDGNKYKRQYIYTEGEERPKYLGTMYIRDDSDYQDTGTDFIVIVPQDLQYNEAEMKALINYYKLASKCYTIQKV